MNPIALPASEQSGCLLAQARAVTQPFGRDVALTVTASEQPGSFLAQTVTAT